MPGKANTGRKPAAPRVQAVGRANERCYTAEQVGTLCASPDELRARWADAGQRAEIRQQLAERGIDFVTVAAPMST